MIPIKLKWCLKYCPAIYTAHLSHTMKILVLWHSWCWSNCKKPAQPIRFSVAGQKPFWSKGLSVPACFLKTLGHQEKSQREQSDGCFGMAQRQLQDTHHLAVHTASIPRPPADQLPGVHPHAPPPPGKWPAILWRARIACSVLQQAPGWNAQTPSMSTPRVVSFQPL